MHKLAHLDREYVWHPFTQMRDWRRREPIVIVEGHGALLRDVRGREYLDANSSIWTNLHGHNHPKINGALRSQLKKIAHSSALGLANAPAALLAMELVQTVNPSWLSKGGRTAEPEIRSPKSEIRKKSEIRNANSENREEVGLRRMLKWAEHGGEGFVTKCEESRCSRCRATGVCVGPQATPGLVRVFFSDDGSTAMEVALKLAYEVARRTGRSKRPKFLSLGGGYHGDTIGAVALGHIDLFHKAYEGLLFKTDQVMAPYCYRCPFNRAKPERADAREYRKCRWECLGEVERKFDTERRKGNPYAAFVFEPLMQGAAGMIPQPEGWLRRTAEIARGHGALLIADEVMTGFGRVGEKVGEWESGRVGQQVNEKRGYSQYLEDPRAHSLTRSLAPSPALFACHQEGVQPDFLALAKGLTGGYLPMAATITTEAVFEAFLGEYGEFKTFFHGHSFTANQLGASAALASLEILMSAASAKARRRLQAALRDQLATLWSLPNVGDIRQVGLVAGVELVKDWQTREAFDLRERAGIRVCEAMAKRGVLTRPVGNVIVLMPPYCTSPDQVRRMVGALAEGIGEVLGGQSSKRSISA